MKFLLKAAFWLGIVVLLLPMPDSEQANGSKISTVDAIAFLSSAYTDVKGFCARNPDSCVTGAVAVQHFTRKAEYGSKILHDFISKKVDESKDLKIPKGSAQKGTVNQAADRRGTLSDEDMQPGYREPKVKLSQL